MWLIVSYLTIINFNLHFDPLNLKFEDFNEKR
ncbi:hypothetical protein CUP1526 [Campylobacter upsaliensis RM3195]|nr:hypothetical protein CUP1526 [Campylobacter upsaliensis RM3195]